MCLNKLLGCILNTNTWLNTCMNTNPKPPTCTCKRIILQMWPFTFSFLKSGVGTRTPPSVKKIWCSTSKIHIQRKFSYKSLHPRPIHDLHVTVHVKVHTSVPTHINMQKNHTNMTLYFHDWLKFSFSSEENEIFTINREQKLMWRT